MIYHFDQLTSTNNEATSSAYAEGDVVWADEQSAGRGQRGHKWESRKGENITFSVVLEPKFLPAIKQFLISEVVTLAMVDALQYYGIGAKIKWTNDIYVNAPTTLDNIGLVSGGVAEYVIRFAMQVQKPDNTYYYAGFTAYCMGQVASFGGSSLNVGDAGAGTITINCATYSLKESDKELVRIDRAAGALIIDGQDLRADLNRLL